MIKCGCNKQPCDGECRKIHLHRTRTKIPSKKDRKIMVMPICPAAYEDSVSKKKGNKSD